ncbi:MAG: 50S ribosomal protein L24 [Candidatus Woykebacteria bacterium GWB1_45_5]|uniref:Large ribosomal subunit protein uL24 n=2 Tax=Candidatus Woykeibacteriota TaxID=1817899 RepID=A0A1G1W2Q8_9BACT|nr:MAG: 50S ribosomal protein L24 [Candidatus Woykebacteria bacterium GWA1_44_8]OGY23322.1 MAG: 50S ribosomal protein L24 [Candidatus Woykebacteria bacterium GWB1_45_5]
MRIKAGDQVAVLQGRDKGKRGAVEKVFARRNLALVAGVNIYKKHVKRKGRVAGGIIEVTKPLPAARLALVCPKCSLATRVTASVQDNQKVRVCKKCKQQI